MKLIFIKTSSICRIFWAFLIIISFKFIGYSQVLDDYGFQQSGSTEVRNFDNSLMSFPWAGGLNSCQFSSTDLDFDGVKDLFVFDRIGNRILTFINNGSGGQVDYSYHPEFARKFPSLTDWAILADYNGDGLEDIFTYGVGGIKVYKSTSTASGGLSFELVTNQLLSLQYGTYLNIYAASVDYPAIADIDNDGDLDILNFWILGNYVNYHKNMSVEKYGNCNTLDFEQYALCWGYFKEGESSNQVILNISCPFKNCQGFPGSGIGIESFSVEHTGSTLLAEDLDGNGLMDLIIGDVDYPGLIALFNDGTPDSAHIGFADTSFPSATQPVRIFSFPCANLVDVNNDGLEDLLVSPFDPNFNISENYRSVHYYRNNGSPSAPVFILQQDNFLQDKMIDVGSNAFPVLSDLNQDGLPDMVIGDYGFYDSSYFQAGFLHSVYRSRLLLFENIGTTSQAAFRLADTNFAGIAALGLINAAPAFADLDNDGDQDMILGQRDGSFLFFRNHASPGQFPAFDPGQLNYQNLSVGEYAVPQLFDLDNDGLTDLLSGNKRGRIVYFHNSGTANAPDFVKVTDSLGYIDVRYPNISYEAHSTPCFFRTPSGDTRLFVGSLAGGIHYYKGIDGHLADSFNLISKNYLFLKEGEKSAPAVINLDSDSLPELLMGTCAGGVIYYKGSAPLPIGITEHEEGGNLWVRCHPNPADDFIWLETSPVHTNMTLSLAIFDVFGRKLRELNDLSLPSDKITTSDLPGGLYIIKLMSAGKPGIRLKVGAIKLLIRH